MEVSDKQCSRKRKADIEQDDTTDEPASKKPTLTAADKQLLAVPLVSETHQAKSSIDESPVIEGSDRATEAQTKEPPAPETPPTTKSSDAPVSNGDDASPVVQVGDRLQVKWMLDDQPLWWACVVKLVENAQTSNEFMLEYEERPGFPPERRVSRFTAKNVLVDTEEGDMLLWRVEGDTIEPPEILSVGDLVQVMSADSLGEITEVFPNYTFSVLLDSGNAMVCNRDQLEPVDGLFDEYDDDGDGNDSDPDVSDVVGADALADMLAGNITNDPRFKSLEPAKQQHAAEQVAKMREVLFAKLKELHDAKGPGGVVTGEDMKAVLADMPQALDSSSSSK
eukprot:c9309_g1_i2.p1 GENE.c9309_g1_i2~~c9309_g1_i2.p1  ORF type:complete len:354 (+),score=117.94 c9309_g1_i2:54-1064(+)